MHVQFLQVHTHSDTPLCQQLQVLVHVCARASYPKNQLGLSSSSASASSSAAAPATALLVQPNRFFKCASGSFRAKSPAKPEVKMSLWILTPLVERCSRKAEAPGDPSLLSSCSPYVRFSWHLHTMFSGSQTVVALTSTRGIKHAFRYFAPLK